MKAFGKYHMLSWNEPVCT